MARSKGEVEVTPMDPSERLTLTVDWPEITLAALSRVARIWAEVVQGVTEDTLGRRSAVKWVVAEISLNSPLRVVTAPRRLRTDVDPSIVGHIGTSVVDGLDYLQRHGDRPPHFSDSVLKGVQKLARLSDAEKGRAMHASNGTAQRVSIGTPVAASIEDFFGPVVESYGSIEGRLEGVFVHGTRRFFVYESLTNQQVRCDFTEDISLKSVLDAFECRVSVTGVVRTRAKTGQRVSIRAHDFEVYRPDSDLTPTDEILALWRRA